MMVEAIRQGDIPGVQIRCRRQLAASVEVAWSWLSEPARLNQWLAREVRLEPGEGGTLELAGESEEGGALRERGETLEVAPPRRWVLSFRRLDAGWDASTRLVFELTPRPSGCEISVLQQGFEHLNLTECLTIWEAYRRRWRGALERLAQAMPDA